MTAEPRPASSPRRSGYLLIYGILAALTAAEIWIATLSLAAAVRTPVFLTLSFFKASLVAAFFMHLKSDSRYYLLIFLLPVAVVVVFGLVMLIR
ncbi:MAG TPA: cytochrome C oxidase subunit IV family protein [Anaerolineales bacterium]|nr:cytochrome C oxidase subunit IV family protein [Anaerolineales bacterium]